MRITLVTCWDEAMAEVGAITSRVLRQYAVRHGYSVVCDSSRPDPAKHPMWNKVVAMRNALQRSESDWLMWLDADAVVLNTEIQVEDIIRRIPAAKNVAFATDDNGLCAGVFLLKNTPWSVQFLDTVYFLGDINFESDYGDGLRAEQNCIKGLMKHFQSVADRIHLFEQSVMNAYEHTLKAGDFILHLSSFSEKERITRLRRHLKL